MKIIGDHRLQEPIEVEVAREVEDVAVASEVIEADLLLSREMKTRHNRNRNKMHQLMLLRRKLRRSHR